MVNDTILFVDDENKILQAINRDLRKEGYDISLARTGETALQVLEEKRHKVIVSDVKMPGMNGLELLDKVGELYPDMVRIILSGHGDLQLILAEVNRKGIDRYLTKPCDPAELKMILRQAIELHDLRSSVKELRQQLDILKK